MTDRPSSIDLPIPSQATPAQTMRIATDALAAGLDACVATVLRRGGSAPSTPGQKLVVLSNGTAAGTVGGGNVERTVVERMKQMLEAGEQQPTLASFSLAKDLNMSCGGSVELVLEPLYASSPVLLVGAGHVGLALARVLDQLQFRVTITDERPTAANPERFASMPAVTVVHGTPQSAATMARRAAVVVATHAHDLDEAAVTWAVTEGFSFVGGVGSRAKAVRIRKALLEKGIDEARVQAMRMPVGLSIGARTPEEIAVSIAAELVAWRAGQHAELVNGQAPVG